MPYLKLETNVSATEAEADALMRELSSVVSSVTGKPENVVQVVVVCGARMMKAGTVDPTAHIDFKAIAFDEAKAPALSKELCMTLEKRLGIRGDRVFIAFSSYKGSMWGVDGRTF